MSKIKIFNDLEEYIDAFSDISLTKPIIPVFISPSRKDLEKNILLFEKVNKNYTVSSIFRSDYGLIVSDSLTFYKKSNILCKKWLNVNHFSVESKKSLVIIATYKDFTQKKILSILNYCFKKNIQINFLIGRDVSSVSWLIAKQFLNKNQITNKAIFSLLNLKSIKSRDWSIFDAKDLEKKNIKKILLENYWSDLVLHGHGKEDHLNLNAYTISNLKNDIPPKSLFAPSIGHDNQSFFKDIKKSILIKKINVDRLYILSCNNLPFYDSSLYDSKYNIVLDSIDGLARTITASLSVQSADTPELSLIMKYSSYNNLPLKLNDSLSDVEALISLIQIGLPGIENNLINTEVKTNRLTKTTRNILSRISSYSASTMLNTNHPIYKLSKKIFGDYMQFTSRGTIGNSVWNMNHFESELINRVNPLSKRIAELMLANPNDELHNFDNFNTYRSILIPSSINKDECICGGELTTCRYEPEISTLFPIIASYCYKCGDKSAKMIGMPTIEFSCDEYNKNNLEINYQIIITSKEKGDVFFGVQLPNYVADFVESDSEIHKLKFKKEDITKKIEGTIKFKENTILQSYYLKLFVVQNAGLEIDRCFFNLI